MSRFDALIGHRVPTALDLADEQFCIARRILDFMGGLRPHLEVDGCLFTHAEPWLDPHKVEDLWYFDGPPDSPGKLARSFAAVPHRVLFVGEVFDECGSGFERRGSHAS